METIYLATLDNEFQATLLQDLLRNDGIESFLKNEIISSVLNIPGFQREIYNGKGLREGKRDTETGIA